MRDTNQTIIKFTYDKNLNNDDFFISKSNKHIFEYLNIWPKWEKNFINIIGEKLSGKTHLTNIFIKRHKGIKIEAKSLNNDHLKKIKIYENIILENLTSDVDEKLLYSLLNLIDQDNKYIIITSSIPIVYIDFKLNDLKSGTSTLRFLWSKDLITFSLTIRFKSLTSNKNPVSGFTIPITLTSSS